MGHLCNHYLYDSGVLRTQCASQNVPLSFELILVSFGTLCNTLVGINSMETFEQQLESLYTKTKSSKINELCLALNVSQSTIRTWKSRGKIPASAFRKAEFSTYQEKTGQSGVSKEELKNTLMEGLFTAIQIRAITLPEDVKISLIADILIKEISENHQSVFDNEEEKQLVK